MATLKKNQFAVAKLFIIPALLGGVIAWVASGEIGLGLIICLSFFVGNWIGYALVRKKNNL